MRTKEHHVKMFMGTDFTPDDKFQTVADLRRFLAEMDKELGGWGDEEKISDVHMKGLTIEVSLAEGIAP